MMLCSIPLNSASSSSTTNNEQDQKKADHEFDAPQPQNKPTVPYAINPSWKSRRAVARRLEFAVGLVGYFTSTDSGLLLLASGVGCVGALLWVSGWLR